MKDIVRKFKSVEEALKRIETQPVNPYMHKYSATRSSMEINYTFCQTNTLQEAITLARTGWDKGNKIISKLTNEHQDAFIKLFPKQDWTTQLMPEVAGEIVNMDAVLTNQPETMLHFNEDLEKVKAQQNGKMQRIIVSGITPCFTQADTIFNRGAIVSSMINTMELAGFRTELWLVHATRGGFRRSDIAIKYYYRIKNFDEDLNLNHISFTFCHPSMLRRIEFALVELEQEEEIVPGFIEDGYGRCIDITDDEIQNFEGELQYGNIYFETLWGNKSFADLVEGTKTKIEQHFMKIKI